MSPPAAGRARSRRAQKPPRGSRGVECGEVSGGHCEDRSPSRFGSVPAGRWSTREKAPWPPGGLGIPLRRDRRARDRAAWVARPPGPASRAARCGVAAGHRPQRVSDEEEHRPEQRDAAARMSDADGVRPAARQGPRGEPARQFMLFSSRTIRPSSSSTTRASRAATSGVVGRDHEREAEPLAGVRRSGRASAGRVGVQMAGRLVAEQQLRALASARAIATRWASPPESSAGRLSPFRPARRVRASPRDPRLRLGRFARSTRRGERDVFVRGEDWKRFDPWKT